MNLINYLKQYATVSSPLARFFVILIHTPILALILAVHIVEAVVRMANELVMGLIGVATGAVTNAHTFVIEGFKNVGATLATVAKGPVKVAKAVAAKVEAPVVAVKAELAKAADTAIAAVKADEAQAEAMPKTFAQHVEAAAKGLVNGTPLPTPVAPVVPVAPVAPVKAA